MFLKTWKLSLVFISASFSLSAYSADFSGANALFKKRGDGTAATQRAVAAYQSMLPKLKGSDYIYAVSQMAYLQTFLGVYLVPESNLKMRKQVFGECHEKTAELINPAKVGSTTQYYNWKGICLAFWGKASTVVERAMKIPEMKRVLAGGFQEDQRYFGGGIKRLAAGLYGNPETRTAGLYNPTAALQLIDEALNSPAYPGDANAGYDYYGNYRLKAEILISLGRKAEAITLLDETLAQVKDLIGYNALPAGLEPETKFEYKIMQDLRAKL